MAYEIWCSYSSRYLRDIMLRRQVNYKVYKRSTYYLGPTLTAIGTHAIELMIEPQRATGHYVLFIVTPLNRQFHSLIHSFFTIFINH